MLTSDRAQYSLKTFAYLHTPPLFFFFNMSAENVTVAGVHLRAMKVSGVILISDDGALLQRSGTVGGLVLL